MGSARSLRPRDFAFPTYRDHGVTWSRGVPPLEILSMFRGVTTGGWDPNARGCAIYTIVIGNQALHGVGYAMGVQLDGTDDAVIAYFGDGATDEGDVNEALVFGAVFNAPVVFFCQNNQWAISSPRDRNNRVPLYERAAGFGFPGVQVDGNDILAVMAVTREALERARTGGGPTFIEAYTYRMAAHTTSDDPTRYRHAEDLEIWRLRDPIERLKVFLARQGIADRGYFDQVEHEADELADPRPRRGACHARASAVHDVRPRVRRAARPAGASARAAARVRVLVRGREWSMSVLTMAKAINTGLRRAMERDPKVILIGEDIGRLGGVFRITDGLQKDFGEHRVIDAPLAESGIVGAAVGMAMRGYRPVVEIQFDGFVYPAFDQIVSQVAKTLRRTEGAVRLPMVIRIPYGGGIGAVEHHSESPEAYFAHTAGLRVLSPSTPETAYLTIQQAIACDDPVVFFEPKRRYWDKGEVVESPTRRRRAWLRTRGGRASSDPAPTSPSSATGRWCAPASRPLTPARPPTSRSSTCSPCRPSTSRRWRRRSSAPGGSWWCTRRRPTSGSGPRSPRR